MRDSPTIPVLDAGDASFAEGLLAACVDVGFVAVTGHGIEPDVIARMRRMLVRLFDADDHVKQAGSITKDEYRGFITLGRFTPNRREINGADADRYEGYKLHWECPVDHPVREACSLYGPNRWAPHVPDMPETVLAYWDASDRFAYHLLGVFAPALGIEPPVMRAWHDTPLTNMTLLHYPPHPGAAVGIHPHKDTNVLTLLHPDPVGGLEVRHPDGSWIGVDAPADALVVNVGEMLELWSGGRFLATPHRVINRSAKDRYSFPWFLVPNHDVVIEPLVPCREGFRASAMEVGALTTEVWRTNWPDELPSDSTFDLGALDR